MRYTADFLIIGSGIAGLTYALKVAPYGKVIIVTKDNIAESNTRYAQGGIAAVMYNPDSFEKHIQDTITAGAGLCDEKMENTDKNCQPTYLPAGQYLLFLFLPKFLFLPFQKQFAVFFPLHARPATALKFFLFLPFSLSFL